MTTFISWMKMNGKLLSKYKAFGEDPFCAGAAFSARSWAEKRCKELVNMMPEKLAEEKATHDREWKEITELRRKD